MGSDIGKVTKEFLKYDEFIIKMKKIIEDTEAEIDAEDPQWREREHENLYGKTIKMRFPVKKYTKITEKSPKTDGPFRIEEVEEILFDELNCSQTDTNCDQ